jgi:putative ABC transport system permease protein
VKIPFAWERRKGDLRDELAAHLGISIEERVARGESPEEARASALRELGNLPLIAEVTRNQWGWIWCENLLQDLRYGMRQLMNSPGFAMVSVLALSLGVGVATALFSVMDAVLLRPLPFAHQERLEVLSMNAPWGSLPAFSYPAYLDLRTQMKSFDALAGYAGGIDKMNLEAPAGPVSLRVIRGTDNFFELFGVKSYLGRTYLPGEDQSGKDDVVVLSYEVWKRDFAGNLNAVGSSVRLGGNPYTVIGVMPPEFRFPLSARDVIYTPLHPSPVQRESRAWYWLRVIGSLKTGVSREQAASDFNRVLSNPARASRQKDGGVTGSFIPLTEEVNTLDSGRNVNGPITTLALACLALLGIACVNVAGLLLGRGIHRERELALRAAIGARRTRLLVQMLTESVLLGAAGLCGGTLTSYLLLKVTNTLLIKSLARGADVRLDLSAVTTAFALSLLTSTIASILPALRLSAIDPNRTIRAAGSGFNRRQFRLRSVLVLAQITVSMALLVVSGLLLENLRSSLAIDLGFNPQRILATEVDLSPGRYAGRDPVTRFYRPLLERISRIPGVVGVGIIDNLPVQSWGSTELVHIAGQPPDPPDRQRVAEVRYISDGYFDAMGIKLTRGRLLSPQLDRIEISPGGSVVVNDAFRRRFLGDESNPAGVYLDRAPGSAARTAVVGVVTNVRQDMLRPPLPEMDRLVDELPAKQRLDFLENMTLAVRSTGSLAGLVPELRNAFHAVDPTVPFQQPQTMTEIVGDQLIFERLESWLFGIFASVALLLTLIGLYGLLRQEVELSTRQIGIRMALGSTRGMILVRVLRRAAILLMTGIAAGLALTLAIRRIMVSVVDIHPGHDLVLVLVLSAGFAAVGLLSALFPARRAASLDPVEALRTE